MYHSASEREAFLIGDNMKKILQDELVKLAKELCKENYHFGYDIFVECYDIPEWKEFFNNYKVYTNR